MSNTGKQSPLGVSSLAGLLQNKGFWINQPTAGYMGSSTSVSNYTYGTMVSSTALNNLTNAIRQGYVRYLAGELSITQYTNLISIGHNLIPALGNSPPSTYTYSGSPSWSGAGYVGETASYGFFRLFPWQAYNEFNYNQTLSTNGRYNDFVGSFMNATSFIDYSNQALTAMQLSNDFLKGTYSNMNDLITADVSGVNLATRAFGQDLLNLGKALDLKTLYTFGLPSNLLTTIKSVNGLTASLRVALIASGLTTEEIDQATDNINVTKDQQQKIYGSFLIIAGIDLYEILVALNCNTSGLETLADLLNPKKMFPNSYQSLTVPVYNATGAIQPTNSKTYYPIYVGDSVNSALNAPAIVIQLAPVPPPQPPGPAPAVSRSVDGGVGDNFSSGGRGGGERGDGSFSQLTDRDGNPIGSADGGSWNSPGEAASGWGGEGFSGAAASGDGSSSGVGSGGYSGTGGGYGFGMGNSGGDGGGDGGGGGD